MSDLKSAAEIRRQAAGSPYAHHLEVPPIRADYRGTGKLLDKVALITGGDSGIGQSAAVHFAREGADIAIVYLEQDEDAEETRKMVEAEGRRCLLLKGDIVEEAFCIRCVQDTVSRLGKLDILINNAGTHEEDTDIAGITKEQLIRTFAVNTFSFFYFTKAALEVMGEGSSIINTASIVAYRGSDHLLDYSASKGAVITFTRSLAKNLADKKIRVNAVAPGPIWTPLIYASFDEEHLSKFGKDMPMGRAGYAQELGPAYVYLASADSTYVTGQVIHVNGGEVING